jgi:endonuclease/exonuclease/phosphatase family metal-dependent hydrolase
MFAHVSSLKRTIDNKRASGTRRANFLAMGDLNTMGLNAPWNDKSDLDAQEEIQVIDRRMRAVGMTRLEKTYEASWCNGKPDPRPSRLDHVFAADRLRFELFDVKPIRVIGWPNYATETEQLRWIEH